MKKDNGYLQKRRNDYLPAGYVAVNEEEYEELKSKAELYDMYQKQIKANLNRRTAPNNANLED